MQLKIECTAGAVLARSDGRILRQHQRVDAHRTRTGDVAVEKKRRFVVSYVLSFIAGRGHAVRTQAALVTVAELITGLRRHEQVPLGEYEVPYPQQKEKNQASLAGPDQPLEHFFPHITFASGQRSPDSEHRFPTLCGFRQCPAFHLQVISRSPAKTLIRRCLALCRPLKGAWAMFLKGGLKR